MNSDINPNAFLSEFLVLSNEVTTLRCMMSLLATCRSLLDLGLPGPELRQISFLLDGALSQVESHVSSVSLRIDILNRRAQQALETMTAPPASDSLQ
jgi:hypothetical protein